MNHIMLEAKDIIKDYMRPEKGSFGFKKKAVRAVDGISLKVAQGEIFGFLGPNGAGKSTTMNIMATLLKPTSGEIYINGIDAIKDPFEARKYLGYVFQDPSIDEQLTAIDNLYFQGLIYNLPLNKINGKIKEVLELVELTNKAEEQVKTFSGGMKRRLEIARGLMHSPPLLFLDEPTIGLDPQSRKSLWQYILDLNQKKNQTIFMTTHYMEEAEFCDRIAIVDHGKIIAEGTPAELKEMVGDDIIEIGASDMEKAYNELTAQLPALSIEQDQDHKLIIIECQNGHELLSSIFAAITTPILSFNLRKPTLDDVFIKLTGKEMEGSSIHKNIRKKS